MTTQMKVDVSTMQGKKPVTIVTITGQVDANNAKGLEEKVIEACKNTSALLFDMGGVTYMSSAGYRAIHKGYKLLHPGADPQLGGLSDRLKMLNPPDGVRRVMKTLGFDTYIPMVSGDLRGAVDSF